MANVTVTGATGMIGRGLVAALTARGHSVTALSRNPDAARERIDCDRVLEWQSPTSEPAPVEALSGADAVINLLGEPIAQRWTESSKRAIYESRVLGTRNLVGSLASADPRPAVLVSQSASGLYGARGSETVDESDAPAAGDFLAEVAVAWEGEALAARAHEMRVVTPRTGVVLSPSGGALSKMLPAFRLGIGGPVAGGRQYVPWIHIDDVCEGLIFCMQTQGASGAVNLVAPEPATNYELTKALGRALGRPAVLPVPEFALQILYGQMAQTVTTGARVVPKRLLELGYRFSHTDLDYALQTAVAAQT
jgi:uncharacterized protein (TIGR01777 family)